MQPKRRKKVILTEKERRKREKVSILTKKKDKYRKH